MGQDPDDERLEELRKQKMEELKQRQQQGGAGDAQAQAEAQQAQAQEAEAQKKAMLRQYLTDGARQRLNSVRMSKPQFAEKVEQQVLALGQSGRLQGQIDEEQMKDLLRELKPDEQSFNIQHR